jgi:hypothetical protein
VSSISIEAQTDTTVNLVDPTTNQIVQTLPAREIAYGLPSTFGTTTWVTYSMIVLADNGNTGYSLWSYAEVVESVRLLNFGHPGNHKATRTIMGEDSPLYYNPEQKILQHYRFPELFIRRTKTVYISVVDDSIVSIARKIGKAPTLNALKMQSRRTSMSMKLKYCRKIYASWLHRCGISSDLIDMLQGRIGKNIFLKHYLTPSADYKDRVLQTLEKLQRQL